MMTVASVIIFFLIFRHLECWVCLCRAVARATDLPGGQRGRPTRRDNKDTGHAHQGADTTDEP